MGDHSTYLKTSFGVCGIGGVESETKCLLPPKMVYFPCQKTPGYVTGLFEYIMTDMPGDLPGEKPR